MENEVFLKKLGEKIVLLRKEKSISQIELARRLNTHNNQIRRIELGLVSPTITTLLLLSKELDISISDLVKV